MLSTVRSRALWQLSRRSQVAALRSYSSEKSIANDPKAESKVPNVSKSNETTAISESAADAENFRVSQSPNRKDIWSKSQNPREKAMSGPRFEQTIMELQPAPYAAIDLIHKQPVRWVHERVAVCDGGGGPLGHPRIYINLDKPQICPCEYCGLPFANEHHRAHLEAQAETSYPLGPTGHAAEVSGSHS